jgi:hypothetical protein
MQATIEPKMPTIILPIGHVPLLAKISAYELWHCLENLKAGDRDSLFVTRNFGGWKGSSGHEGHD